MGRHCKRKMDGSYRSVWKKWWRKRKNYPKCVPIAKARRMTKGNVRVLSRRKQAKANTGPTPSRAATFAKKKKTA